MRFFEQKERKKNPNRKAFLLKRYVFSVISGILICAGILYAVCSSFNQIRTDLHQIKNADNLSDLNQINIVYTLDTIRDKNDGGVISYIEENLENLTEECVNADVIAEVIPTGKISLNADSIGMEICIKEVYKGSEFVNQDQYCTAYSAWAIAPNETGSYYNYYGYLNIMYPDYPYLVFARASDFQVNGQRELYFMGPLFSYMRTGSAMDSDSVINSMDLIRVKESEYMTMDTEVVLYLNKMKRNIMEKVGICAPGGRTF